MLFLNQQLPPGYFPWATDQVNKYFHIAREVINFRIDPNQIMIRFVDMGYYAAAIPKGTLFGSRYGIVLSHKLPPAYYGVALVHELLHIKQFTDGRLIYQFNNITWEDKRFNTYGVRYYDLPWEKEILQVQYPLAKQIRKIYLDNASE